MTLEQTKNLASNEVGELGDISKELKDLKKNLSELGEIPPEKVKKMINELSYLFEALPDNTNPGGTFVPALKEKFDKYEKKKTAYVNEVKNYYKANINEIIKIKLEEKVGIKSENILISSSSSNTLASDRSYLKSAIKKGDTGYKAYVKNIIYDFSPGIPGFTVKIDYYIVNRGKKENADVIYGISKETESSHFSLSLIEGTNPLYKKIEGKEDTYKKEYLGYDELQITTDETGKRILTKEHK